ncbi:hypothetical protein ACB092_10G062800 [Castanea dentata]
MLTTTKKSRKVIPPLPPGPRGLPIIGYLPLLGTELHRKFEELAGVYGPIYKVWLGQKLCVVVNSPSLVKEVVRDQDTIFCNRDPPIAALAATFGFGGADIAFSSYGPDWRKLRKIFVREMLSNANLESSYTLKREEVKNSIRNVYDKIGTPIDFGELAFVTVINAMLNMWGGTLQGEEGAKFKKLIAEMVLFGKPNVSDLSQQSKMIFQWSENILDTAIEKRMNSNEGKQDGTGKFEQKEDFLQFLLELRRKNDAATSISMTQVKALLWVIMEGGSETTATTVEWVMAELMQHSEAMRKVNEELTEIVGSDSLVEESHLPKLHYLDAVVKKTCRLHPALPFLVPRCPSQSSTIGGYYVPKATRILLHVWAIHRDPNIWENPLEFQPVRFLNDPSKFDFSGNDFKYIPFGSGRRICAGIPLAERTLTYTIASFLHSFEWKLPQGTELEFLDKFGIVAKKLKPTVAIPAPKLSKFELYTK